MSEAAKVIVSSWSVVFIVLFLLDFARIGEGQAPDPEYFAVVFIGAVTGAGWLIYRSNTKETKGDER